MKTATSEQHQSEAQLDIASVTKEQGRAPFEQLETQQYQLVLPAKYEELRSYLENDNLLTDEEITKCLYDDTLRRDDLAKRVGEKLPETDEGHQRRLTDYLWDVHQSVKGLPLHFVDPKQTYRIDVVDSGTTSKLAEPDLTKSLHLDKSLMQGLVSPVTLHLDINGGFLANFLHNARLSHQQMNRFIEDLEKQHHELKKQLASREGNTQVPAGEPEVRLESRPPVQAVKSSGLLPMRWQRMRKAVNGWFSDKSAEDPPDGQPRARQPSSAAATVEEPAATSCVTAEAIYPAIKSTKDPQAQVMKDTPAPTPNEFEAVQSGASRPTRYQWNEVAPQFEKLGITRQDLEKAGQLEDLLNGRKTGLMKLTQTGEEGKQFQVSGKLYIVNTPDKGPIIGIQPERKQLLLPKEFLGYEFSARDKQNLEKHGEMGKRVELTDKVSGKKFEGYVGVDKETRSLTVLRAQRLHIPQTIKGVTLTKQQQKNLEQGRAIKLEGMTSNNGQSFNAYVQVSAAKRSLTFAKIPDNAVRQTVDQKTAQDMTKPAHQLKGDGAGGKRTIQTKSERRPDNAKQTTAQQAEAAKPGKKQKVETPKLTVNETKPKKQKGQRIG